MSKKKPVTSAQTESLRTMANAKGISRELFQAWLDESAGKMLDELRFRVIGITPPPGARIYPLHLRVKLDGDWLTMMNEAGPDTPPDYSVRIVGYLYLPTGAGEVDGDYILLNYQKGDVNWHKALTWAKGAKLHKTVPREAFAVGKQFPNLHHTLGPAPMCVVATTDCSFDGIRQTCDVCWGDSAREAGLRRVSCCVDSRDWFLFRK